MKQRVIRFLEKKFYRGLSLMLTLALVFTMMPTFVITAHAADSVPSYIFDISHGDITIAAGAGNTVKVTYGASNVTTEDFSNTQEITITGTTTANKVVVGTGVTAKITLNNAEIQPSNGCAFDIQGNSNVELTLAEGTTNTLKSSDSFAGLQVQEEDGNAAIVTIQGTGTLNAIGGGHGSHNGTGAGIGGGSGSGGNITINSGIVTAKGGGDGAGIGGGDNGAGGNITISGGTVTAESTWEGAAIGGGSAVCDNITISGGTVTAIGGAGAGIGSGMGYAGGTIAISGNANVTATGRWGGAGIGGGKNSGNDGTIKIDNTATVIAVSDGTKNAISGSDNAIEAEGGTVANVLMASYLVPVTTETKVKNGSGGDLTPPISYVPVGNKSIAFTVPSAGDYTLYTGGKKQQGNKAGTTSSTFSVEAGLNTFLSVTEVVGEVAVTEISVNGTGDATVITTNGGILQMKAVITPSNATNKEVTWSVENVTGSATISKTGLLTATKNGTVTVKATAKDGSLVFGSKEITISGQVVTMTGTITIEGTAKFGQTLTAKPSLANGGTVTYQWSRAGVEISGATNSTYTLKEDDIGKTITVTATADGTSGTGAITSGETGTIAKADGPTAPIAPVMASKIDTSVTLTANDLYEYSKDNGATWQDSGVFTELTQSIEYTFVARVKATPTTNESAASVGTKITTEKTTMTGTVTIEGTAKFGQILTATPSLTNAGTITYQWNRNEVAISGATSLTYTLKEDDIGKTITVTATADGTSGTGAITSGETGTIAKADGPTAPIAPVMASKIDTSVTLTANDLYEYSKDNGATWQDSGVFTELTQSIEYTFVARVKATSTTNESAASVGTKITTEKTTMTGTVTIEGTAKFGQILTATPSLTNAGTITYQWNRNEVAISGATSLTYTLKEDDIGKTITVTATADGTSGTGSITSEATVAIAKADAPSAPLAPVMASKTHTSVTLGANALYQFSKNNGATWQASEVFTGLTQSIEYTFVARVKATSTTNESAASVGTKITTEKTTMTGTVTIEGTAKFGQTLTATPSLANGGTVTYQWNRNGVVISGATGTTYELVEADISKVITVTATADGTSGTGAITSGETGTIAKADGPMTPIAPVMASKTHTSVTLGANALHQFSKDNGLTWQDGEVFTGLSPSTTYTFVARVKGTSTTNESVAGTGTSITTDAAPYVPPTPTPTEPEPRPEAITNTDNKKEQIIVDINDGKSDKLVSEITIERETSKDGTKKDTVKYEENKAKETVGKLKEEGKDTARIVIPDKKDEITETKIDIPKNTLNVLGEGNINLEISTENARISLPKETIKDLSKGNIDNLYFRVVPIKKEEQKNEVTERIKQSSVVMQVAGDNNISVVARPMIIETNMSQNPVDIILPLKDVVIPTDPREREELLKKLAVYIEHSDGEKELIRGGIVEYKDGVLGIKFRITKFSTFTIIMIDTPAKSNACEVTSWTKPTQLTMNGTTVTKAVGNEVTSITVEVTVSDKATYKLYSDETCTKEISDKIMRLNVGENEAYIKVTAEDGTQKIYKLQINRAKISDTKNVPQITFVGVEHSPLCVGETERFSITSKSDNKVQYRMFLHNDTNKTKEELTNGYTELVRPDFPYIIAPDHKFTLGKYRVEIWVKQEGSNNQYDSTYTAYLNCVNKDDKNRVYTNGDLMIEKDTYTVGEKVVISGMEDIGGLTGPYYYRLHILRPDQIDKDGENSNGWYYYVTDYKSAIEWTPQEPGTYIMDVHVITPNSILWKNKDRKSKLIYGTYEGWKLKTIIVNEKPTNNDLINKIME